MDIGLIEGDAHTDGVALPSNGVGMRVMSPLPSLQNKRHRCAIVSPDAGTGADTTLEAAEQPPPLVLITPVLVNTAPNA